MKEEGEEWRPIKNFDAYFISNFGRVKSIKRNKALGGFKDNIPILQKAIQYLENSKHIII